MPWSGLGNERKTASGTGGGNDATDGLTARQTEDDASVTRQAARAEVTLQFAWPYAMGNMRGGGPCDASGRCGAGRVLGAGVLSWMEDSDFEAEEIAERERRRNEVSVLGRNDQGEHQPLGTALDQSRLAPRRITGQVGGLDILVCKHCCRDAPTRDIGGNRACCGEAVCTDCAVYSCTRCPPTTGANAVNISLTRALGPGAFETTRSAAGPNGDESDGPETHDVGAQDADWDWNIGLAELGQATLNNAPDPAQEALVRNHSGGMRCGNCDAGTNDGVTQWRLCRCYRTYCLQCSSEPCVDCPALHVWRDSRNEAIGTNQDGTADHTEAAPESTYDPSPLVLTPAAAAERRAHILAMQAAERTTRRREHRQLRKQHIRGGRRPRREKSGSAASHLRSCQCHTGKHVAA